jgi:hypothetical protein
MMEFWGQHETRIGEERDVALGKEELDLATVLDAAP